MAENSSRIACPVCGATYGWKLQVAGRKVRCKCDAVIRLPKEAGGEVIVERPAPRGPAAAAKNENPATPAAPPPSESSSINTEDSAYSLALPDLDEAPPATPAAAPAALPPGFALCPSCQAAVKTTAVICINCGMNFRQNKKVKTAVAVSPVQTAAAAPPRPTLGKSDPEIQLQRARIIDYYLPLTLVFLGVIGAMAQQLYFSAAPGSLLYALGGVAIQVFVAVPVMMVALFAASRILGIGFGSLIPGLIKIAAITLAPAAASEIVAFYLGDFGGLAGFFLNLILVWILLSVLFDMDASDAFQCLIVIAVVRFLMAFFIVGLIFAILL